MPRRLPAVFALVATLLLLCACASARLDQTPAVATLRVGDALIDYRDLDARSNQNRPLLLLTGYAATMDMWDQTFVRELSAGRRVILVDNRGMGLAPAPQGPLDMARMAADAAAVLDALGIRRADVLGWSMGGFIAQELALARPDLVGRLVLYATQPDNGGLIPVLDRMGAMTTPQLLASLYPKGWAVEHPDVYTRMPGRVRPPHEGIIAGQYAAMKAWPGVVRRLPELRIPTLLVVGEDDWVCPPVQSRRLAAALPGARLVELPRAGHWMMHQYPLELARIVSEFLSGANEPPASKP